MSRFCEKPEQKARANLQAQRQGLKRTLSTLQISPRTQGMALQPQISSHAATVWISLEAP